MSYLLDTCVISELRKKKPDSGLVSWINEIPAEHIYLSAITIGELYNGIAQLKSSDVQQSLFDWVEKLIASFENRIMIVDMPTAKLWGEKTGTLKLQGKTLSVVDGLLAATAICHGMVFVTRNTKDIVPTGVEYLNPWKS